MINNLDRCHRHTRNRQRIYSIHRIWNATYTTVQRIYLFFVDRTADQIDLTEKNHHRLILSRINDNTNNKICILPRRMCNARNRCRLDKLNYRAAIPYLMEEDGNQHMAGLPAEPTKKFASVIIVRTVDICRENVAWTFADTVKSSKSVINTITAQ